MLIGVAWLKLFDAAPKNEGCTEADVVPRGELGGETSVGVTPI